MLTRLPMKRTFFANFMSKSVIRSPYMSFDKRFGDTVVALLFTNVVPWRLWLFGPQIRSSAMLTV